MKKLVVSIAVTALVTAVAAPAFAEGWGRHSHGAVVADALLWPIAAALTIPAAIIGGVAQATLPHPVIYGSPPPPVVEGPGAYAGPGAYYAPRVYVEPRVYYVPRGYYAPRAYYPARGYRYYRGGW